MALESSRTLEHQVVVESRHVAAFRVLIVYSLLKQSVVDSFYGLPILVIE